MPNLLDYKDSKNIIIYLFTGLLALAIFVYQDDQNDLKSRDESFAELIKTQNVAYTELVQKECGQLVEKFKELKIEQKEMRIEQKETRTEQRNMAIDIATLKALKRINPGGSNNAGN